jgi:hypothetical protein
MTQEERYGDWMQTVSGRAFWPVDPRPEDIYIEDIAHALSMMCRYGGHCRVFYSVAEHSLHISNSLSEEDALWGLLHDAPEAYIADIVRPAKRFISGYSEAEDRLMQAVCQRFGLSETPPPSVKKADNAILLDEMPYLLGEPALPWNIPGEPLGVSIQGYSPEKAKEEFLNKFYELTS